MSTCEYIFSILIGLCVRLLVVLAGVDWGCCCVWIWKVKRRECKRGVALLNGQSFEG